MNCKHCNTPIPDTDIRREAARMAGSVKSERRAAASRANGRKGGRPRVTPRAGHGTRAEAGQSA